MKNPLFHLCFLLIFLSINSCKKAADTTTVTIPLVTTNNTIIDVTSTAAQSGGIITSDGGGDVATQGVCYSQSHTTPTIADSKTTDALLNAGVGDATFISNLTPLTANTTYYLRAYATNSAGTGYGSVVKFTTSNNLGSVIGTVTTFAGSGAAGYADGTGTAAQFNNPEGISIDTKGNLFVSDTYNNYIRQVTPSGAVTTIAGNGTLGYVDGPAATAEFYAPMGSAFDSQGNLYVADFGNNVIRKITPAGVVSTYAGNGSPGYVNGSVAANIEFRSPSGVAIDASGNLYVTDRGNNAVRKVTPDGVVSTLAGLVTVPSAGYIDATGESAAFNTPNALLIDADGNLIVVDEANAAIRRVTAPGGVVTTILGGPSHANLLNFPTGAASDKQGNLYIVDESGRVLQYTTANVLYVLAGTANVSGLENAAGANAQFNNPQGVAVDASGNVYVADQNNNCIRKIAVSTTISN